MKEKTLLISPSFFGYQLYIAEAIKELGKDVYYIDDRQDNSTWGKALLRLNRNFISNKIDQYFEEQFSKLKSVEFKYIIIINPEALNAKWIMYLKSTYPNAKFSLYLWDSIGNKKNFVSIIPLFDTVYTFDHEDALKYNLVYKSLFYLNCFIPEKNGVDLKYDLVFIGTGHSDRINLVKNILKKYHTFFKHNYLYYYLQSRLIYFYFRFKDESFKNVSMADFKFKSISIESCAAILKQAKFVLDINHRKQVGLTIRTLEALGSKRKLITTNARVLDADFYHPSNIFVIDRENPVIPSSFLTGEYSDIEETIYQKYELKNWLSDFF